MNLQRRSGGGRRGARVRRRDDVGQQRQHRLHREAAMRIRSRAASVGSAGLHRLLDRRALHGGAEHLIAGDGVHHPVEGRRLLVPVVLASVLVSVLVADRGGRLLRVRAHRALHARGRVDAVTCEDVVDPRQGLGETGVLTCVGSV